MLTNINVSEIISNWKTSNNNWLSQQIVSNGSLSALQCTFWLYTVHCPMPKCLFSWFCTLGASHSWAYFEAHCRGRNTRVMAFPVYIQYILYFSSITKSKNHQLVIKLPIGDLELGIGVLGLGIRDFPNPENTNPWITNWLLYYQLVISTFSSLLRYTPLGNCLEKKKKNLICWINV